ncbi:MAG: glycosyltransferase family 2 protein [Lachnospiraceae bacterium]|nr:glycosyltransferase family 2 protein [Lachnospiraceae bacterium]
MEIKISVIVPVYNVENYLERCLDSIAGQKVRPLEIILVDDGSTDSSGVLCDKWKQETEKTETELLIRVLHKKNEGLTAAWKDGCAKASGIYVGFVDSDDYITPDMYSRMLEKAEETGAEIVCCGIRHVYEDADHKEWDDEMQLPKDSYIASEMIQEVYPVMINNGKFMGRGLQPNRVSKMIKRELVVKNMWLCDPEVSVGEDYQFSLAMFLDAEKIAIIPAFMPYYYYMHKQSMTGVFRPEYLESIKIMKKHLMRISDYFGKYDFSEQITNDFLCLAVLHLKEAAVRNRKKGYHCARGFMKAICTDPEVIAAVQEHTMNSLTYAERLFIFFMKKKYYLPAYMAVNMYFR